MGRPHRLICLGLALLAAGPLGAAEPELVVDPAGWLTLARLPPVLADEEVSPHLTSGLTTTLVFRLDAPRGSARHPAGAARVEIRYELWDEVYLASLLGADGELHRESLASAAELHRWWAGLRPRLRAPGTPLPYTGGTLRVSLDVVPFSHSEQLDAQRWFSETVHRAGRGAGETSRSTEEGGSTLERLFSVLIATSIQRRSLASYRWSVELPAAPEAP